MIKVEVEDYCHQCLDFEPDLKRPDMLYSNMNEVTYLGDTIIKCQHREKCKRIFNYLQIMNYGKCRENGTMDKKE